MHTEYAFITPILVSNIHIRVVLVFRCFYFGLLVLLLACEDALELAREDGRDEAREVPLELVRLPANEPRGDIPV